MNIREKPQMDVKPQLWRFDMQQSKDTDKASLGRGNKSTFMCFDELEFVDLDHPDPLFSERFMRYARKVKSWLVRKVLTFLNGTL